MYATAYQAVYCECHNSTVTTALGEHPTLPELLELNIPLRVRDMFDLFGIFLLNDDTGDKMAVIIKEMQRKSLGPF